MEIEKPQEIANAEVKTETETSQGQIINVKMSTTEKSSKLPESYSAIYSAYTGKQYEKCLKIIESVNEDHIEYEILKSACLIHQGSKIFEAHRILDSIMIKNPNNAYTIYAKGLAFYHEEKWEEAVENFERARELDDSSDMKRAEIMKSKALSKCSEQKQENKEAFSTVNFKQSPGTINRRFGCELCGHFFGKKFNLDRHNRSIHKRDTPQDFPLSPTSIQEQPSMKTETFPDNPVNFISENSSDSFEVSKKIRAKRNPHQTFNIKSKVKCNICKKFFKRGSLSRHMVIHSGLKVHACATCDRAFYQKSDLLRHEVRAIKLILVSFLQIFSFSLLEGSTL